MSGLDTARLLLAGVPTAREVEYHVWTATKPEYRGHLYAAGEMLLFTFAQDEAPPVHELPTERFAHVYVTETSDGTEHDPPRLATLDPDDVEDLIPWWVDGRRWLGPEEITGWLPARVVRDDEQGPVAALRNILRDVRRDDVDRGTRLQAVAFAAREALKRLDGETS